MPAPVIIVTGVSRGIGRAIAEELQSHGAAVVRGARYVADVPTTASLLPIAADVTQETGRKAILEAALAAHGRIDGLVNNAGSAFRRASVNTARLSRSRTSAGTEQMCALYTNPKRKRGK
ncbi:MAG TPA: SDR family NAD(P)-dependent oxidoreductase [Pirellulales bacterium]|jgi:NAD(P)-dependent dehydrogenase (short-subunit alcohol dehydrogenase family)|nr:SDR family NAD(P)-dependent oxidoreductase [Pirellulales bacterium]